MEFHILYKEGISRLGDLIDIRGARRITKSGSWFAYGSERIGRGADALKRYTLQETRRCQKKSTGEAQEAPGYDRGGRQ